MGNELMNRIKKSQYRILFQETFKGYGKALNLMASVKKALTLETNFAYFIIVLVVRGSASALCKATLIKVIVRNKESIETKKAISNLYWNTVPTMLVYVLRFTVRQMSHYALIDKEQLNEMESTIVY